MNQLLRLLNFNDDGVDGIWTLEEIVECISETTLSV